MQRLKIEAVRVDTTVLSMLRTSNANAEGPSATLGAISAEESASLSRVERVEDYSQFGMAFRAEKRGVGVALDHRRTWRRVRLGGRDQVGR